MDNPKHILFDLSAFLDTQLPMAFATIISGFRHIRRYWNTGIATSLRRKCPDTTARHCCSHYQQSTVRDTLIQVDKRRVLNNLLTSCTPSAAVLNKCTAGFKTRAATLNADSWWVASSLPAGAAVWVDFRALHAKLSMGLTYLLTYLLTYSMVKDTVWKADSHSAFQTKACFLHGTRGSLPCPQKPATGPYSEAAESSSPHRSLST
jgi:hypothetical protein